MDNNFYLNSDVKEIKWTELLKCSKYASPFQTPDFYKFFRSIKNFSSDVIAIQKPNFEGYSSLIIVTIQKEQGLKGFLSKRGIIYGGPLVLDNDHESLNHLINYVSHYYKSKLIYLEIRNFFNYHNFSDIFLKSKWNYLPYLNFQLDLQGRSIDDVISFMNYNRRREIRLSLERNCTSIVIEEEKDLAVLYNILKDLYSYHVKLPLPSIHFFQTLWGSGIGKVFGVLHNGQIIGGSFCIILENQAIYTMYYCGLRNYQKKIFPTHLAILAAIEYGINNGLHYLDFMGAGKKGEEYGVRKYKQEFGGELVEFGRYLKINNHLLYFIGRFGLKQMRKKIK